MNDTTKLAAARMGYVDGLDEAKGLVRRLHRALDVAEKYVGRGIVEHAYDDCALSGEHAMETIKKAREEANEFLQTATLYTP